ncbi:MAG: TolC family protein [Candidatus Zeuxoniibacter abyssi]|nr:MAG: TolC family protein [Candidatus Persebacteraceae bacterium AB1(2)]
MVDLVSMAKGYNAVFLSGKADIDIRREDENIARSAFLPQASVNVDIVTETRETGRESRNNLRFSLSETYSLSRLRQWEAAKKTSEATRRRYDAAKQTLYLQVINAWLLAQESADGLRLIEARIKNLTEQLKRAEALAEAGRGTRIGFLQSRAGLANAQAQLARAKNNLAVYESDIAHVTGGKARLVSLNPLASFPALMAAEEWLLQTSKKSPTQAVFRAETEGLRILLKAAEEAVFPSFSASAQVSSADNDLSRYDRNLVLSLQQLIFSGGRISAEKRKLLAQINQARNNLYATQRSEAQEVRRLHAEILAGLAEINAFLVAEKASQSALKAIVVGFGEGVYLATDVLDGEEELFSVQSQLRQSRYNHLRNWAALHTLSGQADDDFVALLDGFFVEH